jgi:hypothetical protein
MTFNVEATIASNDSQSTAWNEDSFLGILHERHQWDAEAYFRFEAALYEFCDARMTDGVLRKWIEGVAARVFSYTMLMFSCHFDPSDGFRIQNLNDEELRRWRQRLQLVFEGFFSHSLPEPGKLAPHNRFIENP